METVEFDPGREADRISAELRGMSSAPVDPSPIIRTALPFYGVGVDRLRRIARSWRSRHPDAAPAEVAALCEALWQRAIREEMVVAALIHGHDAAGRSRFGLRTVDRWSKLIDNWETADAVAVWSAARTVADDPERGYRMIDALSGRRNPWARRIGLVACLGTARDPENASIWWPRSSAVVLRLAGDGEAGIPKAISWVLREHTRHTAGEVARFLDERGDGLPAIAVRETRNKLRTGTKSGR